VIDVNSVLLAQLLQPAVQVLLSVLVNLCDVRLNLLEGTLSFIQLVIFHFAFLFADLDFLVKGVLDVDQAILLVLLHLELILVELVDNAALDLLTLELQVLLYELLLLQQSQLLGLLQLKNFLADFAFSLRCQLLPQRLHFELVRLVDLVDLLGLAAPECLSNDLELELAGVLGLIKRARGVLRSTLYGRHGVVGEAGELTEVAEGATDEGAHARSAARVLPRPVG